MTRHYRIAKKRGLLDQPQSLVQEMLLEYDIAVETVTDTRRIGEDFIDRVKMAMLSKPGREDLTPATLWPKVFGDDTTATTTTPTGSIREVTVEEGIAAESFGQNVLWDLTAEDEETKQVLDSIINQVRDGDATDLSVSDESDDEEGWM